MDCIFCKIVSGEIPSKVVYEDEHVLAFNDIEPQAPIHIVVIPKKHFANILELNDSNILNAIFDSIKNIADKQNMEKGFRIVCNTGSEGGQTVDHLHFHILSGRNIQWPPG